MKLEVIPVRRPCSKCLTHCRPNFFFFISTLPFSKVVALTLLQVQIKSGLLLLSPDVTSDIKSLGVSMRTPGRELSMETLTELIGLVRRHVSLVVSELSVFNDPFLRRPIRQKLVPVSD